MHDKNHPMRQMARTAYVRATPLAVVAALLYAGMAKFARR